MTAEPNTHASRTIAADPVAHFNDVLRSNLDGGRIVASAGVTALGEDMVHLVFMAVQAFTNVNANNDPRGDHDRGAFTLGDLSLIWMINYIRPSTQSDLPRTGPTDVERVLTVMLAEEC